MNIYFAGSIRGGRDDAKLYHNIIEVLQTFGTVLTEHVGSAVLPAKGETGRDDNYIYQRDISWLEQADIVIAEVTQPSTGVGYELAYAEKKEIKVVCLFRENTGHSLSAMIRGDKYFEVYNYIDLADVKRILSDIFDSLT